MTTANGTTLVRSNREALVREVGLVVAASLFVALCARIQAPGPVPFTMQTFAVLLVAGALGATRAAAAMVAYLVEGIAGLPVFAKGTAGAAYLFGETGGYLLGFVLAAYVIGRMVERSDRPGALRLTLLFVFGHLIILAFGFAWQAPFVGLKAAFVLGVAPFLATSVLKSVLAAFSLQWFWQARRRNR